MSPPSQFLPLLNPAPSPSLLSAPLARLEALLEPPRVVSLLLEQDDDGDNPDALDRFERRFVKGWVERVVALGMREMGKGEGGEEWEDAVERAASLTAMLAGHCSAGPSTRTFILPCFLPPPPLLDDVPLPTPPPSRPPSALSPSKPPLPLLHPLPIHIRDTTLLASGTGFRTWGAATLLARRISLAPSTFFPLPSSPSNESLKVLELGSGTGLVGLTAAAVLARLRHQSAVLLTDFDTDALTNLDHNVTLNRYVLPAEAVSVKKLDWAAADGQAGRYDLILAADVVYEPAHASLVHRAVSRLLAFRSLTTSIPTCWVVLPLRRTHEAEHNAFDSAFAAEREVGEDVQVDEDGVRWRLETKERVEESGRDGFGEKGDGVARYWVYRVEWVRVD